MHNWNFATRRTTLSETTLPTDAGWLYAYFVPADCIQIVAILPPDAPDNYSATLGAIPGYASYNGCFEANENSPLKAYYMPQDFALETDTLGRPIILTNQYQATARFVLRITDTTRFSPLFIDTLSWYLASMLAGPLIKGDVGAAEGKRCLQLAMSLLAKASTSDARQSQTRPKQNVPWIGGR